MPVEQQVVVLFAAVKGYLDKLAVTNIADFQEQLLQRVDAKLLSQIREKKSLDADLEGQLHSLCGGLAKDYLAAASA